MAASGQKWRRTIVYIAVICLWMDIHGLHNCLPSHYANETQQTLCKAQCEALCLDRVPTCKQDCNGDRYWTANCEEPVCEGTCSVLENNFEFNRDKLPRRPNVTMTLSGGRGLELSWPECSHSNLTTMYIIEQKEPISSLPGLSSYKNIGWVQNNHYMIDGLAACSSNSYRVMAINRYGSLGFSAPSHSLGLKPGYITNIRYVGRGVYFYKDKDPTMSLFMAVLQWDAPQGWNTSEIRSYEWNHMPHHYCQEISHDGLPMFHRMENLSNHVLLTVGAQSIGCKFTTQVRAVSACNVTGPWTDFTVDLTVDPPGLVENVTMSISATPWSVIMQRFQQLFTIKSNTDSPLLVNIHIKWKPPSDMGSENKVEKYMIRSGRARRHTVIPPTFEGTPSVKNVSAKIGELIFQLPTSNLPFDYGVQIVAVAPNQVIQRNDLDISPMYIIQVDRNDSLASLKQQGKILLDEAGIVIFYINNTLPAIILPDPQLGKAGNVTVNRYALQWGPLVGPNSHEILVENRTVVPLNQSYLMVYLQQPQKEYGIKILSLSENDTDPGDEPWDDVPTLSFTIPDSYEEDKVPPDKPFDMIAVYVTVPIVLGFILGLLFLRHVRRKQHFKHLERRLARADDSDSEDGDHYFIMRTAGSQSSEPDEIPTVVTDQWELPHCCIKIGRILGSGAFGQVVKGRVSRSVLSSRGIDFHGQQGGQGTHVTVAVKMLQECSEERYSQDFLKEIQMMKKFGYHRNIVSMLGCCTLREPFCLIVEYVPSGDLQTYLRKIRQLIEKREEEVGPYMNQEVELFTPQNLLSFARQIVTGMEYLSQKGFVHRDLAARNILVGDNSTVKIADFGLARYIYHDVGKVYVNRHGGRLPLKWMAPESISDMTFSTASDVWSFGILLFEIVTLGAVPYPQLSNTELLQALKQRYIMEKPQNCSSEIYDLMKHCWSYIPASRPSFSQLRETFTAMLEEDTDLEYFDFKVHEDRLYYRIDSDEMDQDGLENEETGGPDELEARPGTSSADPSVLSQTRIVHEIPDENCTIEEFTKAHGMRGNSADDMANSDEYSNEAFKRNASTASSFHNELYQDLDDDRIVGLPNINVYPDVIEGEDTSTGSDEVFEDCQAYAHINLPTISDIGPGQCKKCCKRGIDIEHVDIHVSERIDSGIGSDSSSTRCHTDSSNSSVNSNEYIIPDSPTENPFEGSSQASFGLFNYDDDPRKFYDYHFVNLQTDDGNGSDTDVVCNVKTETEKESVPFRQKGSLSLPSVIVRPWNANTGKDVWSIAETKF